LDERALEASFGAAGRLPQKRVQLLLVGDAIVPGAGGFGLGERALQLGCGCR